MRIDKLSVWLESDELHCGRSHSRSVTELQRDRATMTDMMDNNHQRRQREDTDGVG